MDQLIDTVKDCTFGMANTGICVECGNAQDGCEPDAREYVCDDCGEPKVYGAEEIFMMLA